MAYFILLWQNREKQYLMLCLYLTTVTMIPQTDEELTEPASLNLPRSLGKSSGVDPSFIESDQTNISPSQRKKILNSFHGHLPQANASWTRALRQLAGFSIASIIRRSQ
jgi:hypothetical protein